MGLIENLQTIKNEKDTKIIPENIKKDVQIFDIIGTLESGGSSSGDIKLFDTIEHMQADPNANIDDLATVYHDGYYPWLGNDASEFNLPSTVTFDNPITSNESANAYRRQEDEYSWFSMSFSLSPTYMNISVDGDMDYHYYTWESSDGITYTKTDEEGNSLSTPIIYSSNITSNISKFITGRDIFYGGIFKFKNTTDKNYRSTWDNLSYDGSSWGYQCVYRNNLLDVKSKIKEVLDIDIKGYIVEKVSDTVYNVFCKKSNSSSDQSYGIPGGLYSNNEHKIYIALGTFQSTPTTASLIKFTIDLTNNTVTQVTLPIQTDNTTSYKLYYSNSSEITSTMYYLSNNGFSYSLTLYRLSGSGYSYQSISNSYKPIQKYIPATTQLNLYNESQLLKGISGYGDNGIITGDGSIINTIDKKDILTQVYGLNVIESSSDPYYSYEIYADDCFSNVSETIPATYFNKAGIKRDVAICLSDGVINSNTEFTFKDKNYAIINNNNNNIKIYNKEDVLLNTINFQGSRGNSYSIPNAYVIGNYLYACTSYAIYKISSEGVLLNTAVYGVTTTGISEVYSCLSLEHNAIGVMYYTSSSKATIYSLATDSIIATQENTVSGTTYDGCVDALFTKDNMYFINHRSYGGWKLYKVESNGTITLLNTCTDTSLYISGTTRILSGIALEDDNYVYGDSWKYNKTGTGVFSKNNNDFKYYTNFYNNKYYKVTNCIEEYTISFNNGSIIPTLISKSPAISQRPINNAILLSPYNYITGHVTPTEDGYNIYLPSLDEDVPLILYDSCSASESIGCIFLASIGASGYKLLWNDNNY